MAIARPSIAFWSIPILGIVAVASLGGLELMNQRSPIVRSRQWIAQQYGAPPRSSSMIRDPSGQLEGCRIELAEGSVLPVSALRRIGCRVFELAILDAPRTPLRYVEVVDGSGAQQRVQREDYRRLAFAREYAGTWRAQILGGGFGLPQKLVLDEAGPEGATLRVVLVIYKRSLRRPETATRLVRMLTRSNRAVLGRVEVVLIDHTGEVFFERAYAVRVGRGAVPLGVGDARHGGATAAVSSVSPGGRRAVGRPRRVKGGAPKTPGATTSGREQPDLPKVRTGGTRREGPR
jgi:hypothetical protein